jgi:hypothetical protein
VEENRLISPRQPWSIIRAPHREKDPGEVNVDDGLKVCQGHLFGDLAGLPVRGHHQAVPDDARGRGHQVKAAEFLNGQVRQFGAIVLFGGITGQGSHLAAHGFDLGLYPAQPFGADVRQHHLAALAHPILGQLFADPSGSPGDDGHRVFYVQHDALPLSKNRD